MRHKAGCENARETGAAAISSPRKNAHKQQKFPRESALNPLKFPQKNVILRRNRQNDKQMERLIMSRLKARRDRELNDMLSATII